MAKKQTAEQKEFEQAIKDAGERSMRRINKITQMVREYYTIINNDKMNATELTLIGMDTMMAAFKLICEAHDLDDLNLPERLASTNNALNTLRSMLAQTYLNMEAMAKHVANLRASKKDFADKYGVRLEEVYKGKLI